MKDVCLNCSILVYSISRIYLPDILYFNVTPMEFVWYLIVAREQRYEKLFTSW